MAEQSHLDEMNAAIRAQRERQAVPRSMVSTEDARPEAPSAPPRTETAPPEEQEARRGFLSRLRRRTPD